MNALLSCLAMLRIRTKQNVIQCGPIRHALIPDEAEQKPSRGRKLPSTALSKNTSE